MAASVAAFGGVTAASAMAAAPESSAHCGGSLTLGKATVDDPNLIDYKFNCDYGISAYTLTISRGLSGDAPVDDFSASAGVFDDSGNAVGTEGFSCSGSIPGYGVNCNDGGGSSLTAPFVVEGTFDPVDPYCANVPQGSPAGARPEPTALVELVVTDTTGAQDGPFRLGLTSACPAVHVVAPKPKATGKKTKKTKGSKKTQKAKMRASQAVTDGRKRA
jgi:hypothetical protein